MKHRRLRGPPAAVCSEEIATRFLFVAEYRRRKQLRGFRGVPKRKIVRALPNIVHDVGKATRIETPGCQMDGDSEISCNRIRHSEFSRMSRERTVCKPTCCKTKFCIGKKPLRATRMSRARTCPTARTAKGHALHRQSIARCLLGCRESEPSKGLCNRRAKRRLGV